MNINVTILDDEPDIVQLVMISLKKAGFQAAGYLDAFGFLQSLSAGRPDLLLLDLMLPDADGFDICRKLKNDPLTSSMPIIMLTARTRESDKVTGLEMGADDYITKPFSPPELVARVKAVLRRSGFDEEGKIMVGDSLVIDLERYGVRARGEDVVLTQAEFKLLHLLASNRGKVFSREKILNHLWGNEKAVLDRTVDVHIKNLREKLGPCGQMITNVRGIGYKLDG